MTRDSSATALFRGGFEKPATWGGRKAGSRRRAAARALAWCTIARQGLGAGPNPGTGIADDLVPPPDRIYAIVRRVGTCPPDQRPLRCQIVTPVYNERQLPGTSWRLSWPRPSPASISRFVSLRAIRTMARVTKCCATQIIRASGCCWRTSHQARAAHAVRAGFALQQETFGDDIQDASLDLEYAISTTMRSCLSLCAATVRASCSARVIRPVNSVGRSASLSVKTSSPI